MLDGGDVSCVQVCLFHSNMYKMEKECEGRWGAKKIMWSTLKMQDSGGHSGHSSFITHLSPPLLISSPHQYMAALRMSRALTARWRSNPGNNLPPCVTPLCWWLISWFILNETLIWSYIFKKELLVPSPQSTHSRCCTLRKCGWVEVCVEHCRGDAHVPIPQSRELWNERLALFPLHRIWLNKNKNKNNKDKIWEEREGGGRGEVFILSCHNTRPLLSMPYSLPAVPQTSIFGFAVAATVTRHLLILQKRD